MRFLILPIIAILFVSSCRKFEEEKVVAQAEPFIPQNLYPTERLPAYLNRVVVLPAYYPDPDSTLLDFVDEVFQQELAQERIFETIILDPAYMKRNFGQSRFSSSGTLPESFLKCGSFHRLELLQTIPADFPFCSVEASRHKIRRIPLGY